MEHGHNIYFVYIIELLLFWNCMNHIFQDIQGRWNDIDGLVASIDTPLYHALNLEWNIPLLVERNRRERRNSLGDILDKPRLGNQKKSLAQSTTALHMLKDDGKKEKGKLRGQDWGRRSGWKLLNGSKNDMMNTSWNPWNMVNLPKAI